jgi:hypothetical protein
MTATGTITGGNLSTGGNISVTGNAAVTGNLTVSGISELGDVANVRIDGGALNQFLQTDGNSNLIWASLSVSTIANGTSQISIPAINGNVNTSVGGVANVFVVTALGANVTGTLTTTATITGGNITTGGNLSATGNAAITGNISGGNLITTGSVTTANITTGASSTAGTITGNWTLTAGSKLSATYADLAEYYSIDSVATPGTVVEFGGNCEIRVCMKDMSRHVAGVVSTKPAFIMNDTVSKIGELRAPVALQGRVPCKVIGTVTKGDMMVSAGDGLARAEISPVLGSIIGKALEDKHTLEIGVIEVVVGRL